MEVFLLSGAQAQQHSAPPKPPTTAQSINRAATDATQAAALAFPSAQLVQPALDQAAKPRESSFDPHAIHYPYGRPSLGNIDRNSAANPYGPYSRDPGHPTPLPLFRPTGRAR